jgi:hypothetical protein
MGLIITKPGRQFTSAGFYGEDKINGVSVIYSPECEGSASEFFPKDYNESENYYVYKMGRKRSKGCSEIIPYSTKNPQGCCYGVDNNQKAFIGFRLYLNQKTLIGPAPYDVIWDKAILFKKKR